jgi:virginiamycin B lyase
VQIALRSPLLLAVFAALATASPSSAALTEWPTCSLPLSADQALCEDGRSPNRLVAGPDGGVWFTTFGGEEVGRVSSGGALTLDDLPPVPGSAPGKLRSPYGIALGPDGALWFTEDFGNRIGRVTTGGSFSFFEDPDARPQDVALGPDGALWITESGTNSIGRLTTGGAFTHYALAPTAAIGNKLMTIIAGPDGRMWFAEQVKGAIGAITTAGVVTEYDLPAGSHPQSLVVGSDGAVWFTDFGKDRIGRITTSGKTTFLKVPGAGPASITVGPDGALWVGEGKASGLLRLPPGGGTPTETPLLSGAVVNDVATGPDGALWFVETAHNRIGRLDVAVSGAGPKITSVVPGAGAVAGGTELTIHGTGLTAARRVLFGDTPAARFNVDSATRIRAFAPAHAEGPVPVRVTGRGATSPFSDAAVFTFAADPAGLAAPAPTVPAASLLTPAPPRLAADAITVPLRASGAATYVLTLALQPSARIAAVGPRSAVRTLTRASGRTAAAGRATARLRLSARARRTLAAARRRHTRLYVAVRTTGRDKRVAVRQLSVRLH